MRFNLKKTIVTGASSGIGHAISLRLASEGAELLLVGRNVDKLKKVKEEIRDIGGTAEFFVCDLSKEENRNNLCEAILNKWEDKIDIIVNVAGIQSIRPILNSTSTVWHQLIEINVITPSELLRKLLPRLSDGSAVINISSVAGIMATPGSAVYASTKAAVLSFTRSAAAELAQRGIRVNAILPGLIKTPMMEKMFRSLTREQQLALEKRHLLGFGTPDDIASAVVFIASSEAKWITGCGLIVDGGFTLT